MALNISALQRPTDTLNQVLSGFQTGVGLRDAFEQRRLQRAQQEDAKRRQAAFQQDVGQFMADGYDPDRAAMLLAKYPELGKQLGKPFEMMEESQRQSEIQQARDVWASLRNQQPEVAKSLLEEQASAAENSGDDRTAASKRALAQTIDINPQIVHDQLALTLQNQMGDDFTKLVGQIGPEKPSPTSKQRDYQFYVQQEQAAGRPPLSFNEWDRQARAAGAPRTEVTVGQEARTPFEKKVDERAAEVVLDWTTGGRNRAKQNVAEFRRIKDELESGRIETRTAGDFMPFVSDEVRKIFNEPAAEAVNDIRAIAFQVLRETLGAQFTEKEGERLMATYFDPQLSESANIKRMDRLANLTEQLVEDKDRLARYMDQNRTAVGFRSIADDPMQAVRDLIDESEELEESDEEDDIQSLIDRYAD